MWRGWSRIEDRGSKIEQRYSMRSSIFDPQSSIFLVLLVGSVLRIRLDSHPPLSLLLAGPRVDQGTISRPHRVDHQFAVDVELVGRQNLPELGFDILM